LTGSSSRFSIAGKGVLRERSGAFQPEATLTGGWVPHDTRDQAVDFIRCWSERAEIGAGRFMGWLNITTYDWQDRYGKVNQHNGWVRRDSK